MTTHGHVVALLVALGLVLAGCGGQGEPAADPATTAAETPSSLTPTPSGATTPSPTTTAAATGPSCRRVWQAGATLPRRYAGCVRDGVEVGPEAVECSFGKRLITHRGHFYAVPGGRIHQVDGPLEKDRGYRSAMASCLG